MWRTVAPGIRAFTAAAGYAMAVSFRNATVYTRLQGQPFAAISTEPATASGSTVVDGEAAGSSGGGLSSGAIAGIVVGSLAAVALLAALAAFVFLRLRKRRQREADSKVGVMPPKPVHRHRPDGSNGSTSR
jgi:hypothetical protein